MAGRFISGHTFSSGHSAKPWSLCATCIPKLMGYQLHAIIGTLPDLKELKAKASSAHVVHLLEDIGLVPMSHSLFDELNQECLSPDISSFELMTEGVEEALLRLLPGSRFAYVEADYHGGQGSQVGIVWEQGRRIHLFDRSHHAINDVLACFGIKGGSETDAFDQIDLGRNRNTSDWLPE